MSASIEIRPARAVDAGAIAEIYNQGIAERNATLETEFRTTEERKRWLEDRGPKHPVLVAVKGNEVVGWGSLNVFNPRDAYRFVADISIYIERSARGSGVGSRLLQSLTDSAIRLGFHKLVLAAFPWNQASIELFKRHGFREVGVYYEQGQLDGQWVNTVVMERLLHRR